ncbi:MAG: Rieske 2Fe-2S domain-containing protein [Chloroflexota bacterium]|nr:Rieske 2Fe-2S domain-containing protein [Chloroflexota bacterium]
MADFEAVLKVSDLPPGGVVKVEVGLTPVIVGNVGGSYFAVGNTCPHAELPMIEDRGELDGDVVECEYHGSQFNITTGGVENGPAVLPVQKFAVKVEGDDILVGPA